METAAEMFKNKYLYLLVKLDPLPAPTREWYRSASDCICEGCGYEYRYHPLDPHDLSYDGQPFMHVLCNGDRVKL